MATPMFSFRLEEKRRASWNAAAAAANVSLGEYIKAAVDERAGFSAEVDKQVPFRAGEDVVVEPLAGVAEVVRMRPLDPRGPEVVVEPVKGKKPKNAPTSSEREYTGQSYVFNGVKMYEYVGEDGKVKVTAVPPSAG